MTDGNGVTTYQYNPLNAQKGAGQLTSIDGPWANDEITYTYDELGRIIQRAIQGSAVRWEFDAADRLTRLTNALGAFAHNWEAGSRRLSSVTYPNGQRSDYAYLDNAGDRLLQRIAHSLSGGAKLSEFTYAYDPAGRITQWTQLQTGRTKALTPSYDSVDRLTNVVETLPPNPSTTIAWTYDAADNRTAEVINGVRRDFSYNSLNQLAGGTGINPATAIGYAWDGENRLVEITNATRQVELEYDGLDRLTRIVERAGGVILTDRHYLWCGLRLCEERDATGSTVLKRYSSYGFQNLAAEEMAAGSYFATRDHLGSIRELASGAATVFDYSFYGEQQVLSGALPSDFGFTGHYQIRSSATLLAPFRAYAPRLARWLNRDPRGENGGLNLYAYVEGDPLNHVDPLGLYGMDDLSRDWQSVKDWASEHKDSIKKAAKDLFHKTEVGEEVKKFEDFDETSQKILDTTADVKEALDDPDCGHSGAKLLRKILDWFPSSVQLGPINSADLFRKTLDEGEKNVDAYFNKMNQRDLESQRDARN
jgi:RHS repeat-associated protein